MESQKAREVFEEYLDSKGLNLAELKAPQGIETMIAFYLEERPPESDVDDLLFQWGVYDWGDGEWFQVDITRQFIIGGEAEDGNIWQLSLTFKYPPNEELREIEGGNRWCGTAAPRGVEYFQQWIQQSPSYQAIEDKRPDRVELVFECAE
jgi:hypothetical protein